jgi:glycosyltransferase involved in cell wall biosynthesis
MPKPFFSIIIPFFNRSATLSRAIVSVQAQTFANWELILVDDASSDSSLDIAKAAALDDPRIKVATNAQNQERCRSRNLGIKLAQGQYICFLDSDDYHLPQHLSLFYSYLENTGFPKAFLFSKAWNEDAQGNIEERECPDFDGANPFRYFVLHTVNPQRWCVHASLFQEVEFDPDIPICEDMDLTLRLSALGRPMLELKERTTVYVAYPDSFTYGDPKKWERELSALNAIFLRPVLRSFLPQAACRLRKSACHYHLAIKCWEQNIPIRFYHHAILSFILFPKGYNGKTNKSLLVMGLYALPFFGSFFKRVVACIKASRRIIWSQKKQQT